MGIPVSRGGVHVPQKDDTRMIPENAVQHGFQSLTRLRVVMLVGTIEHGHRHVPAVHALDADSGHEGEMATEELHELYLAGR
jgi:hypothetical protein